MPVPDTTPVEDLSLAELRVLVDVLVGEARRLRADNAALRSELEAQQATISGAALALLPRPCVARTRHCATRWRG